MEAGGGAVPERSALALGASSWFLWAQAVPRFFWLVVCCWHLMLKFAAHEPRRFSFLVESDSSGVKAEGFSPPPGSGWDCLPGILLLRSPGGPPVPSTAPFLTGSPSTLPATLLVYTEREKSGNPSAVHRIWGDSNGFMLVFHSALLTKFESSNAFSCHFLSTP